MPRFEVFSNNTAIGYSELERGDPPMGVGSGKFIPLPAYRAIQPLVVASREASQEHLALSIWTSDGLAIPTQGGVQILDYTEELGSESIEIDVCGIPYPLYEELFPGRYAEYATGFRKVD